MKPINLADPTHYQLLLAACHQSIRDSSPYVTLATRLFSKFFNIFIQFRLSLTFATLFRKQTCTDAQLHLSIIKFCIIHQMTPCVGGVFSCGSIMSQYNYVFQNRDEILMLVRIAHQFSQRSSSNRFARWLQINNTLQISLLRIPHIATHLRPLSLLPAAFFGCGNSVADNQRLPGRPPLCHAISASHKHCV